MHEHATKPATLGVGLSDSPAGLAAWIGEKVVAWSSTRPDGSPAFDRELLLATLTLYWTTEDNHHLAAALLGSSPPPWCSPPARRCVAGPHRDQHLRRRTRPVSQTTSRARRALLQRHLLGRTPHRRPLPRRRRARAAGPQPARRISPDAIQGLKRTTTPFCVHARVSNRNAPDTDGRSANSSWRSGVGRVAMVEHEVVAVRV